MLVSRNVDIIWYQIKVFDQDLYETKTLQWMLLTLVYLTSEGNLGLNKSWWKIAGNLSAAKNRQTTIKTSPINMLVVQQNGTEQMHQLVLWYSSFDGSAF